MSQALARDLPCFEARSHKASIFDKILISIYNITGAQNA
uniref:Uncharacterized protein n=1 Tax=Romanomermis culicivorax TaxID=13658 RepID=A0A915IZR9_ROMCU